MIDQNNQKDEFISRESGYEKEEYTEYHQIMRRKIHKIDGKFVGYSDWEQSRTYSIIAEVKEKEAIRRNINETDVEITMLRILVIYNEDTNKEVKKNLSPKKEIIKGYYTIKTDYKEETKIELVKSDMKDKDNQIIYYKHYIIKNFQRKIITDRNNKEEFTAWEKVSERKRKNIN